MDPWDHTTDETPAMRHTRRPHPRLGEDLLLVIAWSATEPDRIGEAARLRDGGPPALLGRGSARVDDPYPRLRFFRERPFGLDECPPLSGSSISRQHLCVAARGGTLEFERLGSAEVVCNGVTQARGTLSPGDTLALGAQLIFLVVRRPSLTLIGAPFPLDRAGLFGRADAYGMVGESAAMWRLREEVAYVAGTRAHALVVGPSGSGKELVARALHQMSAGPGEPFIARNAAALPSTLIDAELFGNMRNFPNPGMAERPGLIGAADGGSLFLDEIGELPADSQAHLLRVLDRAGEYHRLGETTQRRSQFRLIAATNRPPGAIRADLAARFAFQIRVPDLNERREDIPLLLRHLLDELRQSDSDLVSRFFDGGRDGRPQPRIDPWFVEALARHPFRLHVRELAALLWQSIRQSLHDRLEPVALEPAAPEPADQTTGDLADAPSEDLVRRALARHRGSASRAYRELGLSSRYALYRLMKKYSISPLKRETP